LGTAPRCRQREFSAGQRFRAGADTADPSHYPCVVESNAESLQPAPPVTAEPGGPECGPPRPGRLGRAVRFCRGLGAAGPLALIQVLLPGIGGVVLLGTIARVAPLVRHTWWGPPAAVAVYSVLGGAALLPTFVFSVFAGWAFGFAVGLVTALLGFAGAAAV